MSALLDPLQYEFFRHGLIVATLAGALCGLVGVYVVLRGMSYIGHGLSHAIFGGAVASYVVSINFFLGAGLWGFVSALLIGGVSRRRSIGADAAIGVVTTASFAIGLALISRYHSFTRNFEAALFGNVLGVSAADIYVLAGVFAFVLGVVFLRYRALLFTTFDPDVADVFGVRSRRLDALFSLVLAASIIATMQILGVTLVAAALVVPAVVARLLTKSFSRMLVLSSVIGAGSGFAGMLVSYHADVSAGAAIVLVCAALFVVVFALTGPRRLRRRAPRPAVAPAVAPARVVSSPRPSA
jgi:manganese/iron transport system permease protein/iron/zinc/copper transport system permease protein